MNNTRKNPLPNPSRIPKPQASSSINTSAGSLYDRDGPIPVPDAQESDAESVWALFQASLPPAERPPVASSDDEPFEETVPAPLNP